MEMNARNVPAEKEPSPAKPAPFDPMSLVELNVDTVEFEVMLPGTGEPTGWIWTFAGPTHPQSIEAGKVATRKLLRENQANEAKRLNGKKVKPDTRTVDEVLEENVGAIVDMVVTWRGADVPFSREKATEFLLDRRFFSLLNQISEFMDNDKLFIKDSAKN